MSGDFPISTVLAERAHVLLERFPGNPPARSDAYGLELAVTQQLVDLGAANSERCRSLLRSHKEMARQCPVEVAQFRDVPRWCPCPLPSTGEGTSFPIYVWISVTARRDGDLELVVGPQPMVF